MEWKASEQRRDWWITWSLRAVAVALACALVGVGWFYSRERQAATETQRQLDRANQALAESINSDLALPNRTLTPRQRQSLWKLAVADEPIKSDFVSIIVSSPEESVRTSPVFDKFSRCIGLLWPTPSEAETLH